MRTRRRSLGIVVAIVVTIAVGAVLGIPSVAAAEERPVVFSLDMEASPLDRCGGAEAVGRSVDERLHRSVFVGADEADIAFAITTRDVNASEWVARIVERDQAGSELGRRDVPLPADDCAKALDTLAVVLAIMVGPTRTTLEVPRKRPIPADEPASRPPVAVAPPPRATPKKGPEPLRWRAGALAGMAAGSGILPGVAWGAFAGVSVVPPIKGASAIVRGSFWPARTTATHPPADIDRIGGSLLGCYELVRSSFTRDGFGLAGCGGIDVSRIEARSPDLTRPSDTSLVVDVLGELRLGYRFGLRDHLFLEPVLAVQVAGVLRRDRFTYRDLAGRELTLLEPAAFAVETGIGIAVHFL